MSNDKKKVVLDLTEKHIYYSGLQKITLEATLQLR